MITDLPFDPALRSAAIGIVAVALAGLIGWLSGRFAARIATSWTSEAVPELPAHVCGLTRSAVAALLLAAAGGLHLAGNGGLIVAVGLGVATGLFGRSLARSFGLGRGLAALIALGMFLAVVASRMGGLDPLTEGLDRAYLRAGKTRISLLDLVQGVLVAVLLFLAARGLNRLIMRWLSSIRSLDLSQRVLFQKFSQIAVAALAFLVGIDLLGIDLTALAVFSGAFGLAVGFGLQKTFGNLISGLILLMDRSIKPGDVIAIGDTFGWVNKIGVRAVSLVTRDGKEHLIPNETMMTEPVENWSYTNKDVRLHTPVGVAHGCDIHQAKALMLQAANDMDRVLAEPPPVCWLTGFAADSINFEIRIWICDPENGVVNVQSELLTRIWDLFRESGIVLPYRQHDVYLHGQTPIS